MKNILILIVAAAVFLHFYPQPEVTKFYNESKERILDFFPDYGDSSVRLKSEKIFVDLQSELSSFSAGEIESLKKITSSRSSVKSFYEGFCNNKKRSVIFHPKNQTKICQTISHYENML